MDTILIYLLKAHVVLLLLFLPYCLFIKNELLFKLNRVVLLGIIVLTIGLPLMPAKHLSWTTRVIEGVIYIKTDVNPMREAYTGISMAKQKSMADMPYIANPHHGFWSPYNCMKFFLALYVLVAMFLLVRFARQIGSVLYLIKRNTRVTEGRMKYFDVDHEPAPFSFFGFIVISRKKYSDEQFRQIYSHEKAHADQWHSIDMLLTELVCILLWCNPLVKLLKRDMRLNLEYLADNAVLHNGFDRTDYQRSIIQHYFKAQPYTLMNTFRSAPGMRIEKMNSKAELQVFTETESYKYYIIIPLAIAAYLFINPLITGSIRKNGDVLNSSMNKFKGIYALEADKGIYAQILVKSGQLVMKTLWNDKEIPFEQTSGNDFINKKASLPLHFTVNFDGNVNRIEAFDGEQWVKVTPYQRVKRARETIMLDNGHVFSATIDPWAKAKHYRLPAK